MDCRNFRGNHLAFVDDTLPGVDVVRMRQHLGVCRHCAAQDAVVRRSLLAARNLPTIRPSADFSRRLQRRLAEARREGGGHRMSGYQGPGFGAFAAAAMGVVLAGYIASALEDASGSRVLAHEPVIATEPVRYLPPDLNTALVASVSLGMPVWSTALLAEQAPARWASNKFQLASWSK